MEKSWTDYLASIEIDNNFKILISSFFMPDKILVKEFIANMNMLKGNEESYYAKENATKSLKNLQRVYPPFYPNWFIAAYPDVVNWILDNHEKSSVFMTLTDERLIELEENTKLKNDFIRKLINEYLLKVNFLLECTNDYKIHYKEEQQKYPKIELDNLKRLYKETNIVDGYEITRIFHYNEKNQIIRIDKSGTDAIGKWQLTPYETFDFDSYGMLCKYVLYDHPMLLKPNSNILTSKKYNNEYDSNNRLIRTHGWYETSMYKSYGYNICFKINYLVDDAEILFDHNYFDEEIDLLKKEIETLSIKKEEENSRELKENIFNKIQQLGKNIQELYKQKINCLEMDRFYKKEPDSRYTLIAKIPKEKLIQKLLSFTNIEQFKEKDE